MAIKGNSNVVAMLRYQKTPFWKICETQQSKVNGSCVHKYESDSDTGDLEESIRILEYTLEKLTPGHYFFVAQKAKGANKNVIDCSIYVDTANGGSASISGTGNGNARPLYIGGTEVTADNLEEVLNKKFDEKLQEMERKRIEEELKKENAELKKQLAEKESGINGGLMSIGAIVLPILKKTPAGKQLLAAVAGLGLGGAVATPSAAAPAAEPVSIGEVEQEEAGNRIAAALEKLNTTNALQLAEELELLAKVKTESPDTFNMGLEYLKGVGDD